MCKQHMLANKFVCHTDWRHAENYTFERSRLIMSELILHPDRLFPAEESVRGIARRLYAEVKDLPIVSPHGHTDPSWFADNQPFDSAADLLIKPDHYVFRMLYSLGVPLESLGVPTVDGTEVETDGRKIWQTFAKHYTAFRGTPSRMWLDHVFKDVFGFEKALSAATADDYYDGINAALQTPEF